jgi:hypothetical protein
MATPSASAQASKLSPITGPRRSEITPILSPSRATACGSTVPAARIGCPDICDGTGTPSRSRIVGATSVEST